MANPFILPRILFSNVILGMQWTTWELRDEPKINYPEIFYVCIGSEGWGNAQNGFELRNHATFYSNAQREYPEMCCRGCSGGWCGKLGRSKKSIHHLVDPFLSKLVKISGSFPISPATAIIELSSNFAENTATAGNIRKTQKSCNW